MPLVNTSQAYTLTEGASGIYILAGGPTTAKLISETFDNGQVHGFYISDGTDFEAFKGQYSAGGNSITVLELYESSNSDAPVAWGPGQKLIEAVARAEDITTMDNKVEGVDAKILTAAERAAIAASTSGLVAHAKRMAQVIANLPDGIDIVISAVGHSNHGYGGIFVSDATFLASNANWLDWSLNSSGASRAWRSPVTSDHYTAVSGIYTGYARSVDIGGTWYVTTNLAAALAVYLCHYLPGKKVRTIMTTRHNTGTIAEGKIDNATYGLGYLPSSSNLAKLHKDQVVAALAQMATDDPTQTTTRVHIHIHGAGEADAIEGTTSAKYAFLLCDHLRALEDTQRWNIADANTLYLLQELGDEFREDYPDFNGIQMAAEWFGDRAVVIGAQGMRTVDRVHFIGEDVARRGRRVARMLLSPKGASPASGAAFRVRRDVTTLAGEYQLTAAGASPPASGKWNYASDQLTVRIHKTDADAIDQGALGLGNFKSGQVFKFEKVGDPTKYKTVTLTGPAVDSGTYVSWPCTIVDTGSLAINDNCNLTSTSRMHDGESATAVSDLPVELSAYAAGSEHTNRLAPARHVAVFDASGAVVRAPQKERIYQAAKATGTLNFIGSWFPEDNTHGSINVDVIGKNLATDDLYHFSLRNTFKKEGGVNTLGAAAVDVISNPTNISNPYCGTVDGTAFSAPGYLLFTVTGHPATDIHWLLAGEVYAIPTSP